MDIEQVAGPLHAALAAKGYSALTPVQSAVLAEEVRGRDLLVSAQTGSGKTVAFGLAMAPEVLGGVEALLPAEHPQGLVIAPTRELALQVQREFEWLYADAVVASCVGGMDYRTERRTLARGAHLVVGTPGRLRDHVERGSLDLSELKAVVLDEADEMLDMGFAEDLEFLLGSAPEEKRVLMFSATVPKEIASLAATYQKDALRIEVKSDAKQHADIEYRAISVSNRDKEPAIFNLLRWHDSRLAIVFAKTRANVNHLHARMVNRGFPVVALSGELSQTERLHALQALRDGRARVCIATDVAARGIDLPGLDLVIHADLPSNSETLLHRSGRTGRAGRKGTSVLVVPQAEFRKANRLLQGAKLVVEWGKAPGADEVQAREDRRLIEDPALTEAPGEEAAIAAGLLEAHGADAVAAAFVRLWRAGRSAPEELSEDLPPPAALPQRERGEFGPAVWYRLSVGHTGRAEARWLLPKICEAGSIAKDGIGAIRVQQEVTFVQIAEPLAGRFGQMVEIEPGLVMERLDEAPDFAPPARGGARVGAKAEGRAPRRDGAKPPYQPRPARVVEDEAEAPRKPRPRHEDGEGPRLWGAGESGARAARPAAPGPKPTWDPDRKPARPARAHAAEARGEAGERKPYLRQGEDAAAARKPREDRAARADKPVYKSAGFRSHGGAEGKPARASGYKSHSAEAGFKRRDDFVAPGETRKPRAEPGAEGRAPARREGAGRPVKPEGRSWGSKAHGVKPASGKPSGAKPARPGAKPAAPRSDAKDTSKRFVPPKKPRG
ncbi:DEAD/DEAH box helicase [Pseudogemmobacter sonorensis]|uniref:DEAD/DEAH box helicase n=1 Tax=Pseudogemmobacter sonorensis TaxID=2989681 RepID=UPI003F66A387